jgi:vanillate/3-O-methylgallate O-demethylase
MEQHVGIRAEVDPGALAEARNLEELLRAVGDPIAFLRAPRHWERTEPADFVPPLIIPQVPSEFSTWEREQRAWREGVALFDQSHHMDGLYLSGGDAHALLASLAANKLAGSKPGRAHQIVLCNDDGYLIGDGILFHLAPGEWFMCGAPFAVNWARFNAERSGLDVAGEYEARSPVYANGHANRRRHCRYQLQGPNAWALIEELNGGPLADVPFFHLTELTIAGHRVDALRHGMAGSHGLEIWAPWELRDELRAAIAETGRAYGLAFVGAHAYLTGTIESGWIAAPLPAVYTAKSLEAYREWLALDAAETLLRLGGSHTASSLDAYYVTPFDLGYGRIVDLEHEFPGRDALAQLDPEEARKPVSLVWNAEDASGLLRSMLDPDAPRHKILHLPTCGLCGEHTVSGYDTVTAGDAFAGVAMQASYTVNERAIIHLALVDRSLEVGDEVVVTWGEAGGGFGDLVAEATEPVPIRATVGPIPYARVARTEYRS